MTQIYIGANTPDSLTTIPHYCLATNASTACDYHWHIHLDVLVNQSGYILIPSLLGHINNSEYELYAIHTHDYSGIIHLECCTPDQESMTFTLGNIFLVWGYPLFNSNNCLTYRNQPVAVYVNGEKWSSPTPISQIPLLQHEETTITIGTNPIPLSEIPTHYLHPPVFWQQSPLLSSP